MTGKAEGGNGDREAILATMNYADKAMPMGGYMACWNPMAERADILYFETNSCYGIIQQRDSSLLWTKDR